MNWKNKFSAVALGTALGLASIASTAHADDTEVFFGQVDSNLKIFPNVLFALDTSGSMNWYDSGEPNNRISRMKEAMLTILDNATNVNVGLMRFNGSSGGGPVLFPVTYIDEKLCANDDCGLVNLIARVNASENDAEQPGVGSAVTLTGSDLDIGNPSSTDQYIGLRFTDIQIPSGATVTSAKLEFMADEHDSSTTTFTIQAEAVGDSTAFTTTADDVSGRTPTLAQKSWSVPTWNSGNLYQSPDFKDVVQEVVDHADWCGGQSLSLIVTGTGDREAVSYDNHPNHAPTLKLTYDSTSIPSGEGCTLKTIVSAIAASSDDAEQSLSSNQVDRGSSDLELATESDDQMIGMRFRNIDLPANAESFLC